MKAILLGFVWVLAAHAEPDGVKLVRLEQSTKEWLHKFPELERKIFTGSNIFGALEGVGGREGTELYFAVKGQEPLGFILWQADKEGLLVQAVGVAPGYRGEGIGTLLFDQARAEAGDRKIRAVVRENNLGGRAFVQAQGMKPEVTLPGVFSGGETGHSFTWDSTQKPKADEMGTYYDWLDLPANPSNEQMDQAIRRMRRLLANDPENLALMERAFKTLRNPVTRAQYDGSPAPTGEAAKPEPWTESFFLTRPEENPIPETGSKQGDYARPNRDEIDTLLGSARAQLSGREISIEAAKRRYYRALEKLESQRERDPNSPALARLQKKVDAALELWESVEAKKERRQEIQELWDSLAEKRQAKEAQAIAQAKAREEYVSGLLNELSNAKSIEQLRTAAKKLRKEENLNNHLAEVIEGLWVLAEGAKTPRQQMEVLGSLYGLGLSPGHEGIVRDAVLPKLPDGSVKAQVQLMTEVLDGHYFGFNDYYDRDVLTRAALSVAEHQTPDLSSEEKVRWEAWKADAEAVLRAHEGQHFYLGNLEVPRRVAALARMPLTSDVEKTLAQLKQDRGARRTAMWVAVMKSKLAHIVQGGTVPLVGMGLMSMNSEAARGIGAILFGVGSLFSLADVVRVFHRPYGKQGFAVLKPYLDDRYQEIDEAVLSDRLDQKVAGLVQAIPPDCGSGYALLANR